jgi:hypothetical protein
VPVAMNKRRDDSPEFQYFAWPLKILARKFRIDLGELFDGTATAER